MEQDALRTELGHLITDAATEAGLIYTGAEWITAQHGPLRLQPASFLLRSEEREVRLDFARGLLESELDDRLRRAVRLATLDAIQTAASPYLVRVGDWDP